RNKKGPGGPSSYFIRGIIIPAAIISIIPQLCFFVKWYRFYRLDHPVEQSDRVHLSVSDRLHGLEV
ncbi:MAG TPA: hypothetical protein PK775_09320, partial [Rectinema sp.]|nr:hypothetical protein [Rectinema sp.]